MTLSGAVRAAVDHLERSGADYLIVGAIAYAVYPYIESWCNRHGTLERLRELRAAIPPGL